MIAIILAAGKGRRLEKKFNKPKCLITLPTGETILDRICRILKDNKIKKIFIVTGYKNKLIDQHKPNNTKTIFFPKFANSNNLQSLLSVKKIIKGELLCLFADIIFDKEIIKQLIKKKNKDISIAIMRKKILRDTMRVKIKNNAISEIGNQVSVAKADGNFIGIAKFSKTGSKILKKYLTQNKNNFDDYYTEVFNLMINDSIAKIHYLDIKKKFWKEVDTIKDFNILKNLKKTKLIS